MLVGCAVKSGNDSTSTNTKKQCWLAIYAVSPAQCGTQETCGKDGTLILTSIRSSELKVLAYGKSLTFSHISKGKIKWNSLSKSYPDEGEMR